MSTSTYYQRYWQRPQSFSQGGPYGALERLLDHHVQAGERWLDLGCGDGATAGRAVLARGAEYRGVDISATAVQRARATGLDVQEIADSGSLPLAGDYADGALMLEVLEHLFEPQAALIEAARVLRPGGLLIATVPNACYWRRRADSLVGRWDPQGDELSREQPWRDPHIRFFNQASLRRLLAGCGFEVLEEGAHWGTLMADLPFVNHLGRLRRDGLRLDALRRSSSAYKAIERRAPSLLGFRLHAVARCRAATAGGA